MDIVEPLILGSLKNSSEPHRVRNASHRVRNASHRVKKANTLESVNVEMYSS